MYKQITHEQNSNKMLGFCHFEVLGKMHQVDNMLTISVNADANISNRFETDYELGTVMSIESMLKSCLKHVQL